MAATTSDSLSNSKKTAASVEADKNAQARDKAFGTTKMELAQDWNINGTRYAAGKDVEVQNDHVQAIKENQKALDEQRAWESTHHGAVPMHDDPQEATAQTPTRPLAAPNVVQEQRTVPITEGGEIVEVKDPGNVRASETNERPAEDAKDSVEANKE